MIKDDPIILTKCIAIGDNAIANRPNELVIKVTDYEGRIILSDFEYEILSSIIRKIEFKQLKENNATN